ncbi:hypothetical protein N0O92_01410 [Alkalihalobacillus sp. MEB130]|uniref:hypothetical protein n=1 Tax=Alkalihalobacillus sp. MEB130 TaxID=2976704 RepID=UPI0028DDBC2D|nr:hypothetical protein [Alkalihalobacillus sp. MEB130]MDT8858868.1 hypothetical protein [Alkalihalobacillus sp. MEB130]
MKKWIVAIIGFSFLLVGCNTIESTSEEVETLVEDKSYEKEELVAHIAEAPEEFSFEISPYLTEIHHYFAVDSPPDAEAHSDPNNARILELLSDVVGSYTLVGILSAHSYAESIAYFQEWSEQDFADEELYFIKEDRKRMRNRVREMMSYSEHERLTKYLQQISMLLSQSEATDSFELYGEACRLIVELDYAINQSLQQEKGAKS